MTDQLVETWRINNRVNLQLLKALDARALQCTLSTRGGRTVGQQLAHVCEVRHKWLEVVDRDLFRQLDPISREDGHDKRRLTAGFTASAEVLAELIRRSAEAGGQVKGFKRGIVPMVGYFIAHEAHHRGSILLTLKQSGVKLTDQLKWGIWDWSTI